MSVCISTPRISRRRSGSGWKRPEGECVFSCAESRAVYAGGRLRLDEPGVPNGLRLPASRAECGLRFASPDPDAPAGLCAVCGDCVPPAMLLRVRDDLVGCMSRWLGGVKDCDRRRPFFPVSGDAGMSSVGGVGRGRGPFVRAVASKSTPTYMARQPPRLERQPCPKFTQRPTF